MEDLKKIQGSGLHDYEIIDIKIRYSEARINISFKSPVGENYDFEIQNFVSFEMNREEQWGKGNYVCSSDVVYEGNFGSYRLEIELNSGDQMIVRYYE